MQEEIASRGVTAALRARVREDRDALIHALLAPVHDQSLSPVARQQAALRVLERALGKPQTEGEDDPTSTADLTLDGLAALLAGPDA
jgi:hypothetical protein